MTYRDLQEFVHSKLFQGMLIGLGIGLLMFFVFQAGVFVGYRKAAFSFRFGDNYYRAFGRGSGGEVGRGGPGEKFFLKMRGPFPTELIEGHGAFGEVVGVSLPTFVVAGPDQVEKSILIGDETVIRRFRDEVEPSDVAVGDFTVVLGEPNEDSQIEATLIRLLPPPLDTGEERDTRP